jgi:hypothetical protein
MVEETRKSWWQTIAGVMTAIAALVTAVAGLIVALRQTGQVGRSERGPTIASSPAIPPPVSPTTEPNYAARTASHATPTSSSKLRVDSPAQAVDRKPYAVALPTRREYLLGPMLDKGRYILLAANLLPHTAESNMLAIKMHVMEDGQRGYPWIFSSDQFELTVDERPIRPENHFSESITPGESRERDLHFVVAPRASHAVLRIYAGMSNAEIPLDLAAPGHPQ